MTTVSNISIPLDQMAIGHHGTITALSGDSDDSTMDDRTNRLREIGFSEGLSVEILHQSPFFGRDPIAVRVGAMTVALRRKEANLIKVQPV